MSAPDHTTVAVVRGSLQQIVGEMDLTLRNSAFSPTIAEMADRACGIYQPDSGTIAQGSESLPVFVGTMQHALAHTLETLAERGKLEEVQDGDVYVMNDPYHAGTHVQDLKLLAPYFHDGEILCWLATTAHWADMGGSVAGSFVPDATECYPEGLRLPPMRYAQAGEVDQAVVDVIMANVRVPDMQLGDLQAMVNALEIGRERVDALLARHGAETVSACIVELRERSERQMRSYLEEIPDGVYEFEDFLDGEEGADPPRIALALTVSGSDVTLDFAGSSPPLAASTNLSWPTTVSGALVAIKHVFPDVPVNAGCFAPFHFELPEDTILNATRPHAVGGYLEVLGRLVTVVLGALGKAIPERVPADWFGTSLMLTLTGEDWRGGTFVTAMPTAGGMGALSDADGLVNAPTLQGYTRYPNAESFEQRWPLLFRRREMRADSGGDGRRRGAPGTVNEIEAYRKPLRVTVLGDRGRFAPFGVEGGTAASPTEVAFQRNGSRESSPGATKFQDVRLEPSERVVLSSPGGGGFGPPGERDREAVAADVRGGYVSAERAREVYGFEDGGES